LYSFLLQVQKRVVFKLLLELGDDSFDGQDLVLQTTGSASAATEVGANGCAGVATVAGVPGVGGAGVCT
jgi:hypothetical protein